MQSQSYFQHFLDIVSSPEGRPLLEKLSEMSDRLVALLVPAVDPAKPAVPADPAQLHCVHLVSHMVKHLPTWQPKEVSDAILVRWRSPSRVQR